MKISTVCHFCKNQFEPDRASIMAGDWHTCPTCKGHKPAGDSARNEKREVNDDATPA